MAMVTIKIIVQYMQINLTRGGPIPPKLEAPAGMSAAAMLRCAIYQVVGQDATTNFHKLQKFV